MQDLKHIDPDIYKLLQCEEARQKKVLNFIASENYPSRAILEATGSMLTSKYAEGYPLRRYYSGCEVVDAIELLAIERSKKLFGAEHSNVQPHAGSQANMAVYTAVLQPGDTLMGMSLGAGGHLTHGHSVNISGCLYNVVHYGVSSETEQLDYSAIAELAHKHKPKLIIAGASAYSRTINFQLFSAIAREVGAYFMADMAHIAGLVAAQLHPNPTPYADFVTSTTHKTLRGPRGGFILSTQQLGEKVDRAIMPGIQGGPFMNVIAAKAVAFKQAATPEFKVYQEQVIANARAMVDVFKSLHYRIVSGGTDNHLFVIDLTAKNITGRAAELALEQAGICVSRSNIPFDTQKPWVTSGIRIGTPAMTTYNMQEAQARESAYLIDEVLNNYTNTHALASVKNRVELLVQSLRESLQD